VNISFLLHLYQPITQEEGFFKRVVNQSYLPLLDFIEKTPQFYVSLNTPLSLLEQMDRYGFSTWLARLRALVVAGRVELVGSGAYHPLLPKLPVPLVEQQITLNEYGLGYYFGRHSSFEGNKALLLQEVTGFFPPELAINTNLLSILDSFGYIWVLVDESALFSDSFRATHKYGVYDCSDLAIKVVCRHRTFSNMLSFKRTLDIRDLVNLATNAKDSFVVAFDGEFLGHHFDKGFQLFKLLLDSLHSMGITTSTVGSHVTNSMSSGAASIRTSSWGASDADMSVGNEYPFWADSANEIHQIQWSIVEDLLVDIPLGSPLKSVEGFETLPIWLPNSLEKIGDMSVRQKIALDLLISRAVHSDQFWWASKGVLPTGDVLYSPAMVLRGLALFSKLALARGNDVLRERVEQKIAAIHNLISQQQP